MAEVVIYTKSYCPFSLECKKFFKEKNVEFEEKEVVDDNPSRAIIKILKKEVEK